MTSDCPECGQPHPFEVRWCAACAAPLATTSRAARTQVQCACGGWASWIQLEEDPQVEQPGPYEAQQCAQCGGSLAEAWQTLHAKIIARTGADARGAFPLIIACSVPMALLGGAVGIHLLPTATGFLGPLVGSLVGIALTFALASEIGGRGRCPCGHWLREVDRVDGFLSPETPDDDHSWMTIWHCPRCQSLLRWEISDASFM